MAVRAEHKTPHGPTRHTTGTTISQNRAAGGGVAYKARAGHPPPPVRRPHPPACYIALYAAVIHQQLTVTNDNSSPRPFVQFRNVSRPGVRITYNTAHCTAPQLIENMRAIEYMPQTVRYKSDLDSRATSHHIH